MNWEKIVSWSNYGAIPEIASGTERSTSNLRTIGVAVEIQTEPLQNPSVERHLDVCRSEERRSPRTKKEFYASTNRES
jgi:hypothetical protein